MLVSKSSKADTVITTVDLLRHGECIDGHCYRGSTDVALSAQGLRRMHQRIAPFIQENQPVWQTIITSPLIRCAEFSHALAEKTQLPVQCEPALQEMHFGDWEGQPINDIWKTQQDKVEQWFSDPVSYPPPNGEAADVFAARVSACFLSLIREHQGKQLLIVSHGGVMRMLLAQCLSMSLLDINRFDIPYACLSRLHIISSQQEGKEYYRLVAHNMTSNIDEQ